MLPDRGVRWGQIAILRFCIELDVVIGVLLLNVVVGFLLLNVVVGLQSLGVVFGWQSCRRDVVIRFYGICWCSVHCSSNYGYIGFSYCWVDFAYMD